ncbi:MAG: F0F1 ATP synthase subunit A [Propionibacteriaceae bacterium]|nr:F0F1 ATP synthase subunit A [Propionibacteriaceae bacterium]
MAYPGFTLLEGDVPQFGVSAFDSRPLFPSQGWQTCHAATADVPDWCATWQPTWTDIWITNHIFQAVLGAIIVIAFWLIVTNKMRVVPSKVQWAGEYVYNMIRNGVARDLIGPNYHKYVPFLVAMFSFIIINNLFGEFFLTMFPTFAKVGFAWGLALLTYILYNAVGIKKHGLLGYLKLMTVPAGVKFPIILLIAPLEFFSNFITRPITLGLRLFANLFAGHLLVMIFVVGGTWLVTYTNNNPLYNVTGVVSLLFSFAIFALELLVAYLLAYVFTILTASYVAAAEADSH